MAKLFPPIVATLLAVILLVFVGATPAFADGDEANKTEGPFPIWINPSTGFAADSDFGELLKRSFWPDQPDKKGFQFTKGGGPDQLSAFAKSCADLKRMSRDGYEGPFEKIRYTPIVVRATKCAFLESLRRLKPTQTSYLRKFVLNETNADYLPLAIDDATSCESACTQYKANQNLSPITQFSELENIRAPADNELEFVTDGGSLVSLTLLARGDFNGDDIDDLCIRSKVHAVGGTRSVIFDTWMTRDRPREVLRVLEEDKLLCPKYACPTP